MLMSELQTAIGGHEIAVYSPHRPCESLCEYLTTKGSLVSVINDPAELIGVGRQAEVVIVEVTPEGGELELCRALKEGTYPPAVFALSDRDLSEESAAMGTSKPDEVLTRPVPFAMLIDLIERHAARRHEHLATLQPPLLFGELLVGLCDKGQTGALRITAGGQVTTIYLRDGVPVFAEHGSLGDTLGRILLREGRIDESQFSKAVDLITERLVDNEQLRLGEALIELGYLTADEIFEALRAQVRRKIAASFAWGNFYADFQEGDEHLEGVNDFSIPVHQAIIHGIKEEVSPLRLERALEPLREQYVRLRYPVEEVAARYQLADDEATVLMEIDGKRKVEQLRIKSKLDRVHVDQLLCALQLGGGLELADEQFRGPLPTPAPSPAVIGALKLEKRASKLRSLVMSAYVRLAGRSDREVLEVGEDATAAEVELAFEERTRPYRTVNLDDEPPEVRETAREVIKKLSIARERLTSHHGLPAVSLPTPTRPSERRAKLMADKSFQKGKQLLINGQAKQAAQAFQRAAELEPDELEYQLFAAWLAYEFASQEEAAKAREQARVLAHRVIRADRNHAKALFVVGKLYREQREYGKAIAILQKAAKLDANDLDVARELRLAQARGR